MNYPVIYEKIEEKDFPEGYYYAYIPTLGLTTHGKGIEGAKEAALDLLKLWIEEEDSKKAKEFMFSTIELADILIEQSAKIKIRTKCKPIFN